MSRIVLDRRGWLAGATLGGVTSCASMLGCTPSSDEKTDGANDSSPISDVPLRIVWTGTETELDTIRRTWQSISEQPLDLRLASPIQDPEFQDGKLQDADESTPGNNLIAMAGKADVVVYPLTLMASMIQEKRLMPLLKPEPHEEDESGVFITKDRWSVPPALKVATSFAGQQRAVPLGGHLPALILGESVNSDANALTIKTWADYHDQVQASDGKCAEPTAPGWAGAMFLWRLASSLEATWLFDRESFEPLFQEAEYVAVLTQMAETVQLNENSDGYTPSEIHQQVARGELEAGIGYPLPSLNQSGDGAASLSYQSLPKSATSSATGSVGLESKSIFVETDLQRLTMNPFMLVGSLAASCRQTAAANQFLKWLSGGQGSEPLYRAIDALIDTRQTEVTAGQGTVAGSAAGSGSLAGYRPWLKQQFGNPNVVSTLQLLGADDYYRTLDDSVRQCVQGKVSARKACDQITETWSTLHRKYDLPSQQRAWRRAQGIA